ncbi:ligand-binding/transglycosylase domain-containing protein [Alcanivorax hongdengensis A-11-3]|uniref:Membrane-bound lytic murein transglycosylase F n=1 Tax=Alcanivorax hongdengensis A-11-3 TaxID=1177179 RepID=L0WG10_9GAMM|nr:membrane-bound lytic murein transglycosylase MltF [Alcanivorax hongdengensis]EKF75654.1 ligand-binding/transglycosylase domain-containing protein [Alcanivorax hongdengensis A-11-3]
MKFLRYNRKYLKHLLASLALFSVLGMMLAMRPTPTAMERVMSRGELVVITRPSSTTYYQDQHGFTGMEYELARGFADSLGVKLRVLESDDLAYVRYAVRKGTADLAAAGLVATPESSESLRFTTPYQTVRTLVVHRRNSPSVSDMRDLEDRNLAVAAGTSHAELLLKAQLQDPAIKYQEVEDATPEQLLALVENGKLDYTLINSNSYTLQRPLYPDLKADYVVAAKQPLAWAFSQKDDQSLYLAAQRYLTQAKADGTIAKLEDRFYGHVEQFNPYAARSFMRHLDDRLPRYEATFRQAEGDTGFDWRLLAAVAYQESLWDPRAISPTGVEGLMMLTNDTAREMGISDRTDPTQSITAGAAYLRSIHDRIPERIAEPSRTWMTLAAYNVGMGHLEDARVLTERQGGNPDNWQDVKQRLPMLANSAYAGQLRYGPARGGQAVVYVRHIRRYYDLLVWAENSRRKSDTLLALN